MGGDMDTPYIHPAGVDRDIERFDPVWTRGGHDDGICPI